jgi:hypothetical protein
MAADSSDIENEALVANEVLDIPMDEEATQVRGAGDVAVPILLGQYNCPLAEEGAGK